MTSVSLKLWTFPLPPFCCESQLALTCFVVPLMHPYFFLCFCNLRNYLGSLTFWEVKTQLTAFRWSHVSVQFTVRVGILAVPRVAPQTGCLTATSHRGLKNSRSMPTSQPGQPPLCLEHVFLVSAWCSFACGFTQEDFLYIPTQFFPSFYW